MIFTLCSLFDGTEVDGIHFQKMPSVSSVANFVGTQHTFREWISRCQRLPTQDITQEYIRLTKLAFKSSS
jgi:hypothetical protein